MRGDSGETRFRTSAEAGKQRLTLCVGENTCKRRMKLEFRNVKDGAVRVLADGAPVETDIHVDEFVSVAFDATPGVEYTAEVEFAADAREYRNGRIAWALTRIGVAMPIKNKVWSLTDLDDKEIMRSIMTMEGLTENEKIRLTESW